MNQPLYLTEAEIKYAMAHTKSNTEAAKYLGISIGAWTRYAKLYFDPVTSKSLYEMHCNYKGNRVSHGQGKYKTDINEILEGKHPGYDPRRLKTRLLREAIKDESCELCGFNERRIIDYQVPLILTWKDGDNRNHSIDNLQLICYNCYMLTIGDPGIEKAAYGNKPRYHSY